MAKTDIALVERSAIFSPNNVNSDRLILQLVGKELHNMGYRMRTYPEDFLQHSDVIEAAVVNMCRKFSSVEILKAMEDSGRVVINSGYGIENCYRDRLTSLLLKNHIPMPETISVNANDPEVKEKLDSLGFSSCWIKRGTGHTLHKEDVAYIRHSEEAIEILGEYALRGISQAIICKHEKGDLVKFYGVEGTSFFYAYHPFDSGHSKFGQEAVNGISKGYEFDYDGLHRICSQIARLAGVCIYGGDAIISPQGAISIIDFNDWPSFGPCRAQGAQAIAQVIDKQINKKTSTLSCHINR